MRSVTPDAETLQACVAAAVAAPSLFNTQPWRFRLDPDDMAFEVRADAERSLRYADPTGRALHLSVGACVFNLRVAVAHFGWVPVVRLLPCPDEPGLLATLRLTGGDGRRRAGHRADLYGAIGRRHSSRRPFSDRPVPPQARAELAESAHQEGASLGFPDAPETVRLLRLTAEAEHRNRLDTDRGTESRRWVRRDADDRHDSGLPLSALGPQDAREGVPMRDFTAARHPERLPSQDFETAPVIALLRTAHDRRADWLRAGQALEHVLLTATALGLRASLLHQPMEWADLRRDLSPDGRHTGHAQMLIRLGYGPQGPGTPRRGPQAVLDTGTPRR
jgi:nitroreductase